MLNFSTTAYSSSDDSMLFLAYAIPGIGAVYSLTIQDYEGLKQLAYTSALTAHNTVFFKEVIDKKRPDGTGTRAFPSGHASAAFAGATYLYKRYGWQWGIPAYAASAAIAGNRIKKKKHSWTDVIGGAAIGTLYGFIFTTKYPSFWVDPKYEPSKKEVMLNFGYSFK